MRKRVVALALGLIFFCAGGAYAGCYGCSDWTLTYNPVTAQSEWVQLCEEITQCCRSGRGECSDYPGSCALSGGLCLWVEAEDPALPNPLANAENDRWRFDSGSPT